MRINKIGRLVGAAAAGAVMVVATASSASAADETVYVPEDFIPALSDTRANGHYEVQGSGLHIWTDNAVPSSSQNKVAEYWAAPGGAIPTSASMDYTSISGGAPGMQIVFDVDGISGNGNDYNVLVGESVYGNNWWLTNSSSADAKAADPSGANNGGNGSEWFGTLAEWEAAFASENVLAYGFSLGSGVLGDGVINSMTFGDTTYTFAEHTVLSSKDDCKKGGWATSTNPVFKNQGDCVSFFAAGK